MWTTGDIFKTTYFFVRNTPPQFFICGALQVHKTGNVSYFSLHLEMMQVMVDFSILGQVFLYREETNRRKKSERNMNLWQEEDQEELLLEYCEEPQQELI